MIKVTIAGASRSVELQFEDLPDGARVDDVLVAAAQQLGIDEAVAKKLSPVVDSKEAKLDDVVTPTTQQVTAAHPVANG